MQPPARLAIALATVLSMARTGLAQTPPDTQASGLLEDGRAYWAKHQYKQALDNFNTIVTSFGNTESGDNALLEIGRYYVEVEPNLDKAREAFDQVAKRYPQSDGAPGAYYYLGLLALNAASTPAEMDDAVAQFKRLQRLYPRSEWVPRALYASGLAHRKAGRLLDAVEAERRVSLEHPGSDITPAAQFQIGHCLALLGEPVQAMEEFQQVRNRFPQSEWATQALNRITALYRLHGAGKAVFTRDPAYSVGMGDVLKDVRAILMTPSRTLWIASDKVKSAVPFEADGKRNAGLSGEDLRSLSLTPRGDVVLSARTAIRIGARDVKTFAIPSDKPGIMKPLEKIAAAIVTPGSSLLVADDDKARVYRYDALDRYVGPYPDTKEREVTRMTLDGEGGIVLLDRGQKVIGVFDEAGKPIRSVGPRGAGFELRKPADVVVDPFRNLYVADEELGVFVFSPAGQLLASVTGEDLKRPKAITLDADGSILVYDERAEKVLRFR
jgi:TolA-binding protein